MALGALKHMYGEKKQATWLNESVCVWAGR